MGISARSSITESLLALLLLASIAATPTRAAAAPSRPAPCAEALALERLGRVDASEAAYVHELANPPSVACATAGLKRLGRRDGLCAYASALAHGGERQAAHAAYLRVLAADPASVCASAGVKATASNGTTSVWTTVGNVATGAGYSLGAVLVALLLLAVVALLWLQAQTRSPWLRDRWPARNIRRPVLEVQSLNDDGLSERLGSSIAGLIRGRVTWRTDRFGLNLVSGQAGVASALNGLGDASSEAKAAVAVIDFLTAVLPRRRFQLTGQLQPAGAEGVGLSLELSHNGGAKALVSFWGDSFGLNGREPAKDYQHLAVAAAAWVDIWMAKALDGEALLTGDPQSWAFFRSGVDAQRLGETKRAGVLYEQALAADGSNVGALANLGIICRREKRYEDAEEYLMRALPATEGEGVAPALPRKYNPDWYRIKYQFAALFTNWAIDTEAGSARTQRAGRAAAEAKELAQAGLDTIEELSKRARVRAYTSPQFVQRTLRPFLKGTIMPSVLVLVAGTGEALPTRPRDWPGERPTFEEIHDAIARDEIDPWQLISYVEQGNIRPPATLYNLACFHTRAHDFGTAAKRLLASVRETQRQERRGLIDVATTDPILKPLRDKRPGIVPMLNQMLDPVPPVENAEEMKQHFDRQDRALNHFKFEGWASQWELNGSHFDLRASKDSDWTLVKLAGSEPLTDRHITATVGGISIFRHDHPDAAHVHASIIIPPDAEIPTADLTEAAQRGVHVLRDTEDGFKPV